MKLQLTSFMGDRVWSPSNIKNVDAVPTVKAKVYFSFSMTREPSRTWSKSCDMLSRNLFEHVI